MSATPPHPFEGSALDLAQLLQSEIAAGRLCKNERLWPERDLAVQFRVSRAKLRQALGHLENSGLLYRRRGQGTFVTPPPATDAARLQPLANCTSLQHMMEVRLEVEPALARLAAKRGSQDAKALFAKISCETGQAYDLESYERSDDRFHYAIAQMAENPLFLNVYEAIRTVRAQANWTTPRAAVYSADVLELLSTQHDEISKAILDARASEAEEAMRRHLETVSQLLTQPTTGQAG